MQLLPFSKKRATHLLGCAPRKVKWSTWAQNLAFGGTILLRAQPPQAGCPVFIKTIEGYGLPGTPTPKALDDNPDAWMDRSNSYPAFPPKELRSEYCKGLSSLKTKENKKGEQRPWRCGSTICAWIASWTRHTHYLVTGFLTTVRCIYI